MIKLPSEPEPEMQNEPMAEPPMNNASMMDDENSGMPIDNMGDVQNNGENPFDSNFDAGVEANEETDPKKYIQQLTGKLSQSLRSYNENLPQPDTDLDKYVAGMIIKQAIEGLSPEDTNEILSKVKTDGAEEIGQEEEISQQNVEPPVTDGNNVGIGESTNKSNKQKIDEIFNQVMNNGDNTDDMQKSITDISYKKKPFVSPNFK